MSEYKLADGTILTDEEIEQECAEYETGTWAGRLEHIHVGRPKTSAEPMVTVPVKFPLSMVEEIDRKCSNRSDFIRKAVAASLE